MTDWVIFRTPDADEDADVEIGLSFHGPIFQKYLSIFSIFFEIIFLKFSENFSVLMSYNNSVINIKTYLKFNIEISSKNKFGRLFSEG